MNKVISTESATWIKPKRFNCCLYMFIFLSSILSIDYYVFILLLCMVLCIDKCVCGAVFTHITHGRGVFSFFVHVLYFLSVICVWFLQVHLYIYIFPFSLSYSCHILSCVTDNTCETEIIRHSKILANIHSGFYGIMSAQKLSNIVRVMSKTINV